MATVMNWLTQPLPIDPRSALRLCSEPSALGSGRIDVRQQPQFWHGSNLGRSGRERPGAHVFSNQLPDDTSF